jgi:hypothetical protein
MESPVTAFDTEMVGLTSVSEQVDPSQPDSPSSANEAIIVITIFRLMNIIVQPNPNIARFV